MEIMDLRQGDLRRTVLMQLYLFSIISTLLILKPVANALFLSRYGVEALPYVFICVAIVAFVYTKFFNRYQQKVHFFRLHNSILYTTVVSFFGFFIAYIMSWTGGLFVYLFYIWIAIFALAVTSQFWIFANILFNPREARRLFSVIGAGGIAGGIFGGYLTSILVPYIGTAGLILLAALFMIACIPISKTLWGEYKKLPTEDSLLTSKRREKIQQFSFRRLRKNRHLILLSVLTGIGVMVSKLVDYQFQGIAALHYQNEESLTSFFGFWFSTFNLVGFILQLFFTNKILKVLGVPKAQFILPMAFLLGGFLVFLFPVLAIATLVKGFDMTLKQGVQRSVNELLILPIPAEIKQQSKTFIDVFVDSFATGLSGILLLSFLHMTGVGPKVIAIMIVVMCVAWIALAFMMKKEYLISFKNRFLRSEDVSLDNTSNAKPYFQSVRQFIDGNDPESLLFALQRMEAFPLHLSTDRILKILNSIHEPTVLEALKLRPRLNHKEIKEKVQKLTEHKNAMIRVEAYQLLLDEGKDFVQFDIEPKLESLQQQNDPTLLIACCINFRDNVSLIRRLHLRNRLIDFLVKVPMEVLASDMNYHFLVLKAIALGRFRSMYKYIDEALQSEDPHTRRSAIRASSYTLSKKYAKQLILMLKDPEYGIDAEESLKYYGESLLDITDEIISSPLYKIRTKVRLTKIIASIQSQNAVNFLLKLLNHNKLRIRKEVLFQLNEMKRQFPSLDYNTSLIYVRLTKEIRKLKELHGILFAIKKLKIKDLTKVSESFIQDKKDVKKRINFLIRKRFVNVFLLLGLQYDKSDILDIYKGLLSKDQLKKTYSLEFLEMTLNYKYTKLLSPVIEMAIKRRFTKEDIVNNNIVIPSLKKAFSILLRNPDQEIEKRVIRLLSHEVMASHRPKKLYDSLLDYPMVFRRFMKREKKQRK